MHCPPVMEQIWGPPDCLCKGPALSEPLTHYCCFNVLHCCCDAELGELGHHWLWLLCPQVLEAAGAGAVLRGSGQCLVRCWCACEVADPETLVMHDQSLALINALHAVGAGSASAVIATNTPG
jgi:hypothetical protein